MGACVSTHTHLVKSNQKCTDVNYNGEGIFHYLTGQIKYKGGFKCGKVDGEGTYYYENGNICYKGSLKEGELHGQVTHYSKNGTLLYKGEYENNNYCGQGTFYYDDGTVRYIGEFKYSWFHGQGTRYYKDGVIEHVGGYKSHDLNGQGTLYTKQGQLQYKGEFCQGHCHGKGDYYISDGTVLQGQFKMVSHNNSDAQTVGPGFLITPDGDKFRTFNSVPFGDKVSANVMINLNPDIAPPAYDQDLDQQELLIKKPIAYDKIKCDSSINSDVTPSAPAF